MASPTPTPTSVQQDSNRDLFHISLNNDAESTIVFLHGLLASHLEYTSVIPHLPDYHLLLVDLPAHAGSLDIKPFTLPLAADLVANLIRKYAHNGQAHVVGLSMGGFTALELAKSHAEVVESLWVTGAAPFQKLFTWFAERPSTVYHFINILVNWLPTWLNLKLAAWQGLQIPIELIEDQRKNLDRETVRSVYASILTLTAEEVQKISVRTLTVAGGRQDDVDATKKMGTILKQNNPGSKAVIVRNAMHAWDLQFPELFANGIRAWIEDVALPPEFEDL